MFAEETTKTYQLLSVNVCPYVTDPETLNELLWNLLLFNVSKIYVHLFILITTESVCLCVDPL